MRHLLTTVTCAAVEPIMQDGGLLQCDDCEDVEEISCDIVLSGSELMQPGEAQPHQAQEAPAKLLDDGDIFITALAQQRPLVICDQKGMIDPAQWFHCEGHTDCSKCTIQRNGYLLRPAHGQNDITMLRVPQYKCQTHGKVFNAASPGAIKQIKARRGVDKLELSPNIFVISGKTILLPAGYEYVLACQHVLIE